MEEEIEPRRAQSEPALEDEGVAMQPATIAPIAPPLVRDETAIVLPGRRFTREQLREMVQERDDEVMRLSCCWGNRRGVAYFAGVLFGGMSIIFSGAMIAQDPSYERISIFLPIISATVGIFLPQPTMGNSDE